MTKTTREEIIRVARDMFRNRGFDGFSMADLADEVGMKKASLYSRFSGKEEIACEALALTLQDLDAMRDDRGDWLTQYRRLVERCAEYLVGSKRCIGLHFVYGAQSPIVQEATKAFFVALADSFKEILQGGLAPQDAQMLAEDTLAHLEGATLWMSLESNAGPMARGIETLVQTAKDMATHDKATMEILARCYEHERMGSVAEMKLARMVAQLEGLLDSKTPQGGAPDQS